MADFMRVGNSPRPSTSMELEHRIRETTLDQMSADPGTSMRGTEHVTITAQLEGARIAELTVDASRLEIDAATRDGSGPESAGPQDPDSSEHTTPVLHRETAVLQAGSFVAVPLLLHGVPVDIEARATNLPFAWLTLDDGDLAVALPQEMTLRSRGRARLTISIDVSPDDVVAAIMGVMRAELAETDGIHLDREKLTLRQLGPRHIRINASARLRWKFLRPTLRARTDLRIDAKFIARLTRTHVTSSNLVLAVVLRFFRTRIIQELRTPVDLQAALGPVVLRTLRIHARGARLRVEVEAGLA